MSASGNTITVIHAYSQPNLSLLKYFGYDINTPDESHPLHTHLKTMSWLQLVDPSADPILSNEPPALSSEELAELKASKRTAYYFKRNRWEKFRAVTDEARAGGFDGLIAATLLEPAGILKHAVPLLSGSAAVAIYSPTIEPLTELMDLYSTARRTAFINRKRDLEMQKAPGETVDLTPLFEEFPLDPTRLLPPTLHTTRVRVWQVLPGRTHPLMTGRGGAEGYLFHGVHVIPAEASIQAAGTFRKKRKVETTSTPVSDRDVEMGS
jgi:tRNA (adenine-N(1)-)-methyltransferase non-catalytic subunit